MDGQSKRCPRCATERKEKSFGQQNTHTPLPILTAARPTQAHSASLSPHCPFLKIISLDIETHRAEEEEETHVSQGVLTRKTLNIIHISFRSICSLHFLAKKSGNCSTWHTPNIFLFSPPLGPYFSSFLTDWSHVSSSLFETAPLPSSSSSSYLPT